MDENGVLFSISPENIKKGYWSPNRGLVSESICRQAFEHLFSYKFNKNKKILIPKITCYPNNLELDGYCEELKIAFEYQGYQGHWNPKHYKYDAISSRDKIKINICKKLKVILIVIPPFSNKKNKWQEDIVMNHIIKEIEKTYELYGIELPLLNKHNFKINFLQIHHGKQMLKDFRKNVEIHGGKLLSKEWHGTHCEYLIQWIDGRLFKMTHDKFMHNGWPKNLDKYLSLSKGHKKTKEDLLQELRKIALKNNGKLITNKWNGNLSKYEFENSDGVRFFRTAQDIKDDIWLKNTKEKTENDYLEEMTNIANQHSGLLLSDKWLGSNKKYKFKYSDGTNFNISYNHLKRSGWPKKIQTFLNISKESFHPPEYYLNKMKEIAQQNNCRLLSTEWKGNKHRYLFEYTDGEQFTATYIYLKVKKFKIKGEKNEQNTRVV